MQQFRERSILKTYLAKVVGLVPFDLEKIELAIRPDFNNRPKQVIKVSLLDTYTYCELYNY